VGSGKSSELDVEGGRVNLVIQVTELPPLVETVFFHAECYRDRKTIVTFP